MEQQESTLSHGFSHNLVLLLLFIIGIVVLTFGFIKLSHPQPHPTPHATQVRDTVTVTKKGDVATYNDHTGGFHFTYPVTVKVNDDGVFKYDMLTVDYLPITNINRRLGNDFPPDQYASLAASIAQGTKFQPVRTVENISYPIRSDLETVKIGNRYFVRDFPVTNKDCNCAQIQYVTVMGENFISYSMAKGLSSTVQNKTIQKPSATPPLSSAQYRQLLVTDKEALIKREFPFIENTLASLAAD